MLILYHMLYAVSHLVSELKYQLALFPFKDKETKAYRFKNLPKQETKQAKSGLGIERTKILPF